MKKRWLAIGLSAAFVFGASPANAQEAHAFGKQGQLILSADRLLPVFSFSSGTVSNQTGNVTTDVNDKGASFALLWGNESGLSAPFTVHSTPRVGVDFAVVDHLTIGGTIALSFGFGRSHTTTISGGSTTSEQSVDLPNTTVFGVSPRVGYVLPLADTLAFWPRAGFSYYSVSFAQDITNGNNNTVATAKNTGSTFSLDLDPQFVFVPLDHFFFQFGPTVNIPLTGSYTTTVTNGSTTSSRSDDFSLLHFGVTAGLGGWFNLM